MTTPARPVPPNPALEPKPGRVQIMVRKNGSLRVAGALELVDLVDHEGTPIPRINDKPNIALCRCGMSQRKPFCDSSHKTCGFVDPPEPTPAP